MENNCKEYSTIINCLAQSAKPNPGLWYINKRELLHYDKIDMLKND
jgi:hypothetical protein